MHHRTSRRIGLQPKRDADEAARPARHRDCADRRARTAQHPDRQFREPEHGSVIWPPRMKRRETRASMACSGKCLVVNSCAEVTSRCAVVFPWYLPCSRGRPGLRSPSQMRTATCASTVLIALLASGCATVYKIERAEHRGSQGIPAGHLPPPGSCRVWYEHLPPGQQPPPTTCRDAERTVARHRGARVIYSQPR